MTKISYVDTPEPGESDPPPPAIPKNVVVKIIDGVHFTQRHTPGVMASIKYTSECGRGEVHCFAVHYLVSVDGKSIMSTGARNKPKRFRQALTAFAACAAALTRLKASGVSRTDS